MMKNKYTRLYLLLLTTILMMGGTYASQNSTILTYISKLQVIDSNLPNVANQKGYIGAILGEIFNGSGKIKSDYLDFSGVTITGTFIAPVTSVSGKTGSVLLTKADVGLGNVDNTSDLTKNVLSSSKLTTARNIAGISFNGTADIAIPFSNLISKPTTVAGYGISDFISSNSTTPINPNNTIVNGLYYANSLSLFGQVDGGLFNQAYNSSRQGQIYQDYRTGQIALRGKNNGVRTSWRQVWDNLNDGTSSGLDADLLDGLHSTSFLRTVSDGSYYGMVDAAGSSSNRIRTTTNGIIPVTSGGASSIGTPSWPFNTIYGKALYADNVYNNGGLTIGYGGTSSPSGGAIIAGNMGIGTTNPQSKLEVIGDILSNNLYTNNGGTVRIGDDLVLRDIGIANTIGLYGNQDSTLGNIKLGSNGGTISGYNGNIGIGTISPQATLDVNGRSIFRGMGSFYDPYSREDDWVNSPISIRERGYGGAMDGNNVYSPNLNFHRGRRVSNSLWMDASGILHYGSYGGTGVPASDGSIIAGGFTSTSDVRLKKDIKTMDSGILTIKKLNPVNYYWKEKNQDKSLQYGFIAQEIEKVLPDLVHTDNNGYKSVNYIGVIPILTKSIQEQQKQIDELKKEIDKLK